MNLVNKLYEKEYKKKILNPTISDDLFTNLIIIKLVSKEIKKNKINTLQKEKDIISFAYKIFIDLIDETSEKNFCKRINTIINRLLIENKNEKLLYAFLLFFFIFSKIIISLIYFKN